MPAQIMKLTDTQYYTLMCALRVAAEEYTKLSRSMEIAGQRTLEVQFAYQATECRNLMDTLEECDEVRLMVNSKGER